ncbi:ABC transporter substrate-binding protein [Aureimonas altamirensis]|uniref:ABC transporter substrate-binding protein n=1 Tax=Aureimonas altamirensis TaxID=370622 RepID=UPI001E338F09|nr:ABC transporter substrate-binding protein [Aureimonas altamirensis]UHD46426.1 ABC transporter substrate-binding protein [Aureimonas altamirensis]
MQSTCLKSIVLAGLVLSPLTAVSAELPQSIKDRGNFTLAINATFPPMEFVNPDTGSFEGLDIDLVDAIADRLSLEVVRTDGLFNQLIPALTTGRTDFILSGMIDNEERRETMDFVNYLRAGAQFYVLTGSDIQDPVALCGQTISTVRSTTYPALTEKWSDENCVATGLEPITIVGAESSPEVRMQVRQGRAVAGVIGGETMAFVNSQEGDLYRLIGDPLVDAYYGAAFRKQDTEFRDAFADTLQQLIDDGTYGVILEKWNLNTHAIDAAMINSEPRG